MVCLFIVLCEEYAYLHQVICYCLFGFLQSFFTGFYATKCTCSKNSFPFSAFDGGGTKQVPLGCSFTG